MSAEADPDRRGGSPRRRRSVAMPLLFAVLTLSFVGIAVYAATAGEWVFVAVGAALAAWMATFVLQSVRPRRG